MIWRRILDMLYRISRCITSKKNLHIWLGRSSKTRLSIWGSSAGWEGSARRRQPGSVGGVLGGREDVGRCIIYIGESLGFVLGFRVSPWANRLVRDKGPGKKRGQTGCGMETGWAKARDWAQEVSKCFKIFLNFQDLDLNKFWLN
jgi:hypothetical protein